MRACDALFALAELSFWRGQESVDWQWTLGEGRLNALGAMRTGRLSLTTLAGTVWILRAWDLTAPAESAPVVTLAYDAGRFAGASGCNRYFAVVADGTMPGEVKVGPLAGTRMACPERLAISYTRVDGSRGTMFDARPCRPNQHNQYNS